MVQMRRIIRGILILTLTLSLLCAQESPQAPVKAADMESVLKEAVELQSKEPQAVAEKLAPMLAELRQLRQNGTLGADTARILHDALLLMMRTQIMLLTPEQEILAVIRELLIANPSIDESAFNPREKLLLRKVRTADTGSLTLETTPPGATLSYLGTALGATPGKYALIAGTYRFRLSLPGYLDKDIEATVRPGENLTAAYALRRRAVDIPVAINAPSATVIFNGKTLGVSQGYQPWLASLPEERRQEYESAVAGWHTDRAAYSFFRLADVPVGEAFKVEFQAACRQPLALETKVPEQAVDWTRTVVSPSEFQDVQLAKDVGTVEAASTPSGAEVWIDGSLQGQTPLQGKELCSGTHRIQFLHASGQYAQDITVQRARTLRVQGRLRPALAFLGIYAMDPQNQELTLVQAATRAAARSIGLNCRTFADPLVMPEDIESLRRKGSLPISRLLQEATGAGDLEGPIKQASIASGRAELLLLGLRTGKGYVFRLYSTLHSIPDIIEAAGEDEAAFNFLIAQLNRTAGIRERLQTADLGLEVADSPNGLAILRLGSAVAAGKTALAPGQIVKSVDAKPMTFADFQKYMRSKKPDQTIVLEVKADKEKVALVPLALRPMGAEYPWNTPDGFPNAVLAMLQHLIARDPLAEESKFAALSLARGFMQRGEWKRALEYLGKANLEPHRSGICPGTVLYYQGRCHEALGDRAQAESYYARARDYAEATIGMPNGPGVSVLAEHRLQSLKKR